MFLRQIRTLSLFLAFAIMPQSGRADDPAALKTEYSEKAEDGGTKITYKCWKTFRGGKMILLRAEVDFAHNGKFEQTSTNIMHDGKIIMFFNKVGDDLSYFTQPGTGFTVQQYVSTTDGRTRSIDIWDADNHLIDSFAIDNDFRITPIPDTEFKERIRNERQTLEQIKRIREPAKR